jgi:cytochrome c biogenesis protein ResB
LRKINKRLRIDLPITGLTKETEKKLSEEKKKFEENVNKISSDLIQPLDEYSTEMSNKFESDVDITTKCDTSILINARLKLNYKYL